VGRQGTIAGKAIDTGKPWVVDAALTISVLWLLGAMLSLTQMAIGLATVERTRRTAMPLNLADFLDVIAPSQTRSVELRETPAGSMPMTYGFFRHTILLPTDAAEWTRDHVRSVLLHELAHVRRKDGMSQFVARLALAFYWWHPLVWVAWSEFLKERECAADDQVLNMDVSATDYASHLFDIARSMRAPATLSWAGMAMARNSKLEVRLAAILDSSRNRLAPKRAFVLLTSLAAFLFLAPVAALRAKSDAVQAVAVQKSPDSVSTQLMKQGDVARHKKKFDDAKALYESALNKAANSSETAAAFIDLGKLALSTDDFEQAIRNFEQAQSGDSAKTSEARMWMAITQQRQNKLDSAEGMFQSALSAEDPNSAAAATIMELYTTLLRQQGREADAKKLSDQAALVRKTLSEELPADQTPSSKVHKMGDVEQAPTVESKVEPEYTDDARLAKYSGSTLILVEIGADGQTHNAKVLRGLGFGLDQKALEAVSKWKFKPGTLNGQAVPVAAHIEVNFRLL
jgi:TonB family protein